MTKMTTQAVLWLGWLAISAWAAQGGAAPVAKPTESVPRGGCVTADCHPGVKSEPFLHGPVTADACEACHEEVSPREHTYARRFEGKELCRFCHKFQTRGEYVHKPVSDGDCVDCHNPHGGDSRFLLKGGTGAGSCLECHSHVTEGMPAVHGPVAAGACTACHRPHSSDYASLLTMPARDLCLDCHALLKKQVEQVETVHDPVKEDCRGCHRAHSGETKMLLKSESRDLCASCHQELMTLIEASSTKHNAVAIDKGCRNCHDPHGSDYPAMLVTEMVDVCLSCHDEEIRLPDGTVLGNIKAVLASGTSLHGPIAQQNCVACHHIHGGSYFRLLTQQYPPEFYAPFTEETYALCLSCHDRQRLLVEHTDKFTDFRNGDLNLHYLHVNKKLKGRTCRACHVTHASDQPKHMRASVPFGDGGWELPIAFDKTGSGGSCSPGCHRPYRYDRTNPVAYDLPAKPAVPRPATTVPDDG